MTEVALIDLGYEVVPFSFDDYTWRQATDFFVGLTSNENQKQIDQDMADGCETLLSSFSLRSLVYKSNPVMRWIIDILFACQNNRRVARNMQYLKP